MIEHIEHLGKLVDDTTIPGEQRSDVVAPAHCNGAQLSANRFMTVFATRSFRGCDDDRSIIWQLRRDSYDGAIIKEGMFAQSIDDWYPLGDKYRCVRQYGSPVMFGVPKGALINGATPAHANVFAVRWRKVARVFVPEGGYIMFLNQPDEVRARTQCVEWCQFRLNDAEDDIEMLQPVQQLRQLGYEDGEAVADHGLARMNQTFVQAVPLNQDANEWVDVNHFYDGGGDVGAQSVALQPGDGSRLAALRYQFNTSRGVYEWVETSPPFGEHFFEASIASVGSDWVIAARRIGRDAGIGWARVGDPFVGAPALDIIHEPRVQGCPLAVYYCPDGGVRLLAGDATVSPHGDGRNPLYMWDIDVNNGFQASDRREIFDSYKAGVPIPKDHGPMVDMAKLLPHTGGRTQTLVHRVRTCAMAVKEADYPYRIRPLTDGDFTGTAIYHARIIYDTDQPGSWHFNESSGPETTVAGGIGVASSAR